MENQFIAWSQTFDAFKTVTDNQVKSLERETEALSQEIAVTMETFKRREIFLQYVSDNKLTDTIDEQYAAFKKMQNTLKQAYDGLQECLEHLRQCQEEESA